LPTPFLGGGERDRGWAIAALTLGRISSPAKRFGQRHPVQWAKLVGAQTIRS
jgi:hypothetical protein